MKPADRDSRQTTPSRRDFLKTTSALGTLGLGLVVQPALSAETKPAESGSRPSQPIVIRGHHLFDMLGALGTGESKHKTLGPVAQRIRANPKVPLKLVIGMDDICGPCEQWDHQKSLCKKSLDKYPQDNQNSLTSDTNAIRVLGMKPGDRMNADDLYRLIKAKVSKKVFAEEVCVACRLVNKCKETYEPKIEAAVKALSEPHA